MLDMEDSSVTDSTVKIYKQLRRESLPVALTLQAYLYRTKDELQSVINDGGYSQHDSKILQEAL